MAAQKSEAMESAIVTLKELTADDKIRLQCEARERYELDLKSWQVAMEKEKAARRKAESRAIEFETQKESLKTERQAFYEFAMRNPGLTIEEALKRFKM